MSTKAEAKKKLRENPNYVPFWERVAYGCGDIGTNLYLQSIAMFLLLFYTDYMGIPAVIAGLIMFASRLWDGVNDVFIGSKVDRTGNYKRWIFWGAFLSMFTYTIMYLVPPLGQTGKIIYAVVTFSVWTVTYTMLGVPINAMASTITPDPAERARVNGVRFPIINIPIFAAIALTMPLVGWFGQALKNPILGFPAVAFTYGLVGWLFVLVCIKFVKERAPVVPGAKPKYGIKKTAQTIIKNKPALIAMAMFFFHFLAFYAASGVFAYFCKYVLNDLWILSIYAVCTIPCSFIGMSVIPKIFMKKGVRFSAMMCTTVIAITFLVRFAFPTNIPVVLGAAMVQSFFSGAITVLAYTMIGDVVTYTKWKQGNADNVAIFYSTGIFSQKTAMAFSAFFAGTFLTFFGYVANQPQTPSAQFGILFTYTIIPAICEVILTFIISRWKLDTHESLQYVKGSK